MEAMMAFQGAIFDVDGVLVDSPHELAWRESLRMLMEGEWREVGDRTSWAPERFTSAVYQQVMAGKPRMAGARAALEYFGVPDVDARVERYAAAKQQYVVKLIEEGRFMAFPDALRYILAVKHLGIRVAAASSSKNAKLFLERIRLDTFAAEQRLDYPFIRPQMTLQELFDADISGRDFPRGKPDPAIFLTAASELGARPADCFVVEDAPSGVQAAKAGGMAALGVARLGDRDLLLGAGADLVVPTLDDVSVSALAVGRLRERRAAAELRRRHTERPPSVWTLVYDGFDPARQGLREALCALGNGYFVTRGALPEARADGVNYPGTYVAGLYDRLVTEIAGRRVQNEDLVNVPNWLVLQFRVAGGAWFDVGQADVLEHRFELDLRHGTLIRHLAGRPGPADQHGATPVRVHEGRASRRAGDHLHGRELVGDAGGPLRAGRQGGQRGGQALPRPERSPSGGAWPGRGGLRDGRPAGRDDPVARAGRAGGPHQAAARRPDHPSRPAAGHRARVRRPPARPRAAAGTPGDRGEDRRPLHLQGPGNFREPCRRAAAGGGRRGLRAVADPPPDCLGQPLEPLRHPAGQCQRMDRDGPAPAHLPPAADHLAPHPPPGRRRARARLAWGGLPRPHLLGRDVHLPVLQLPAADPGQRAAGVPARPPRDGQGSGPDSRVRRRDVPVAERLQRAGGDAAAAPQPAIRALAPRQLPPAAARQHRDRLQRLAALHGHREH